MRDNVGACRYAMISGGEKLVTLEIAPQRQALLRKIRAMAWYGWLF